MQLLVIAKGERVNCDENQMIEVVNVTGMRCYRLTTTIAINIRDENVRCLKLKKGPSGVINKQAPSSFDIDNCLTDCIITRLLTLTLPSAWNLL